MLKLATLVATVFMRFKPGSESGVSCHYIAANSMEEVERDLKNFGYDETFHFYRVKGDIPKSYADLLRRLAKRGQYGHSREPHNYYPMNMDFHGFHIDGEWKRAGLTWDVWERFTKYASRYHRFYRYCTEVLPQWEEVPGSKIYWADNSVTVSQQNMFGDVRQVYLEAPHGDLCY